MKNNNALFTSSTDDWRTPSELHRVFLSYKFIDLFPYRAGDTFNQLDISYQNDKLFCNPPYSQLRNDLYYKYILTQACHNKFALLIPSRTDTLYFHAFASLKPTIIFIKGRLHFNDSCFCAPFPSLLLLFNFDLPSTYMCFSLDELIFFLEHNL